MRNLTRLTVIVVLVMSVTSCLEALQPSDTAIKSSSPIPEANQTTVADPPNPLAGLNTNTTKVDSVPAEKATPLTSTIITLVILFIGFSIILKILMMSENRGIGPNVTRIVGLCLVISIAASLATFQANEKIVTPVIGLLGTIAGYLLGQNQYTS